MKCYLQAHDNNSDAHSVRTQNERQRVHARRADRIQEREYRKARIVGGQCLSNAGDGHEQNAKDENQFAAISLFLERGCESIRYRVSEKPINTKLNEYINTCLPTHRRCPIQRRYRQSATCQLAPVATGSPDTWSSTTNQNQSFIIILRSIPPSTHPLCACERPIQLTSLTIVRSPRSNTHRSHSIVRSVNQSDGHTSATEVAFTLDVSVPKRRHWSGTKIFAPLWTPGTACSTHGWAYWGASASSHSGTRQLCSTVAKGHVNYESLCMTLSSPQKIVITVGNDGGKPVLNISFARSAICLGEIQHLLCTCYAYTKYWFYTKTHQITHR